MEPTEFDIKVHLALQRKENYTFEKLGILETMRDPAYWEEAQKVLNRFTEQTSSNGKINCVSHLLNAIRQTHQNFTQKAASEQEEVTYLIYLLSQLSNTSTRKLYSHYA